MLAIKKAIKSFVVSKIESLQVDCRDSAQRLEVKTAES